MLSSAPVQHISNGSEWDKLGEFRTKDSDTDKAFAGFRVFHENVQLSGQLFVLGAILLRFTSDASHEVGGHRSDSYRRKYIVKWGNELGLDDFDSDIVDETFQGNLFKHKTELARGAIEEGTRYKEGK